MKLPFLGKSVPLPKPLSHWYADLAAIDRLRVLLEDPVFQTAIATLKETAAPSVGSVTQDSLQNAMKLHWLAGYHDAFSDLMKLTKIPSKPQQTPQEWMHIQNQTM
jgi:hypothetical protein